MRSTRVLLIVLINLVGLTASDRAIAARFIRNAVLASEAQSSGCESAKELLAKALERAALGADRSRLQEALGFVQLAVRQCPTFGDAFYYGALIYTQLGDATNA